MKPLYDDGTTRILTDDYNLLSIDPSAFYLYCLTCGGIKSFHVLCGGGKEAQALVADLEMTPLCRCYRPNVRFVGRDAQDPVQQVLANIFVGLGSCRSVADVRLMLEEMASREEMREVWGKCDE